MNNLRDRFTAIPRNNGQVREIDANDATMSCCGQAHPPARSALCALAKPLCASTPMRSAARLEHPMRFHQASPVCHGTMCATREQSAVYITEQKSDPVTSNQMVLRTCSCTVLSPVQGVSSGPAKRQIISSCPESGVQHHHHVDRCAQVQNMATTSRKL